MNDPIAARLLDLLSYHAGVAVDLLSLNSRPDDTPGWDSVANLGLLGAVEEEFAILFTTADALRLRSLGDIARFVAEHRVSAAR